MTPTDGATHISARTGQRHNDRQSMILDIDANIDIDIDMCVYRERERDDAVCVWAFYLPGLTLAQPYIIADRNRYMYRERERPRERERESDAVCSWPSPPSPVTPADCATHFPARAGQRHNARQSLLLDRDIEMQIYGYR